MDSTNPLGTNSIVPRYQGEVLQIRFFQGEVLYNPGLYARTSPNSIDQGEVLDNPGLYARTSPWYNRIRTKGVGGIPPPLIPETPLAETLLEGQLSPSVVSVYC